MRESSPYIPAPVDAEAARLRASYIELIKRSVGDFLYDPGRPEGLGISHSYVDARSGRLVGMSPYDYAKYEGVTGDLISHTIIGMLRLNQLQQAIETVLREGVPGDFLEAGILRGGACVFMRAMLEAYGVRDRVVWGADSFMGFPQREPRPGRIDTGAFTPAENSLSQVEAIMRRYGLYDAQLRLLPGWFSETLPTAPIEQLAILRLDADIYESTWQALEALYPKLAVGGYVIVDDYYTFPECREAVQTYRLAQGIRAPIVQVDRDCIHWRRQAE